MAIGGIVPVFVAARRAHQASIVKHLARRRATSPTGAVTFVPDTFAERRALAALIREEVVIAGHASTYYVDEAKVGLLRRRRLSRLRTASIAAAITGAVALGLAARR